jgi:hypothetical protein
MRCTQLWCEENRLDLSFEKSKVMVFFETSALRQQRAPAGKSTAPSPNVTLMTSRKSLPFREKTKKVARGAGRRLLVLSSF